MQTLRGRIVVWTLAVFLAITAASMVAQYWFARHALEQAVAEVARRNLTLLSAALAPLAAERDLAGTGELLQRLVEEDGFAYLEVTDSRGVVMASAGVGGETVRGDPGVRHFRSPLAIDGRALGEVGFGIATDVQEAAQRRLLLGLMAIAAVGIAAAVMLQLPLARRLTGGLRELAAAARRVDGGDYVPRVASGGRDEIADLGEAFNRMSQTLSERVAALKESEQRQRQLVASLAEGVVFQDRNDRVLDCNDAACRILGLTRGQLLGTDSMDPLWRAVREDGTPFDFSQHPSVTALRTRAPVDGVVMGVHRPDGSMVWIVINSRPLWVPGAEEPHATVTSFSDVTLRFEAERTLQQANDELERRVSERTAELAAARDAAEAASRAKSEFLSRMSHELRTPLNAILGFAQVLRARLAPAPPDVDQQLRHLEEGGWHLLDLINDVLDLARIETGAFSVERERVPLAAVVDEAVALVRAEALAAEVGVAVAALPPGLAVEADRTRLRQVLVNLLSNACKYNRRGGRVTLAARADEGGVTVSVEDTGIGLSPEQLSAMFEPFNRLGAERGPVQGTGIGLVISRHLVQMMGGRLEVESTPGVGTTFRVVLKCAAGEDMAAAPATAAELPRRQDAAVELLYVEDNDVNVELMRAVCEMRPNVALRVAPSGEDALDELQRRVPQLMVVDITLPGIDGFEVCRRVRATEGAAAVPMIALSANAMESDRAQGRAAGFDAYLTKPMSVKEILGWIDRVASGGRP